MTNIVDRFYAAVTVLAGSGHVKQRLIKAYQDHLSNTDADEMPDSTRERFAELDARMHGVAPLNGEGPICASVRKMSGAEASGCAHEIVALHAELIRLSEDLPEAMPIAGEGVPVPTFLVKSVS